MRGLGSNRGVVRAIAIVALALSLAACQAGYILQQGIGQLSMLTHRASIAAVLRDPTTDSTARDRLIIVWYARRFARDTIGLTVRNSFDTVVLLDRDAASYVVAAAPSDSLTPYRWCFPIAGCLPYIGYFDRSRAVREAAAMRARGFDVALRGVSAYSLGGWLPDPVYSPLLHESRGWVANTVIHELTHGTVFLPGRADFNESLATFVGDRGEIAFLVNRYGPNAPSVVRARQQLADQRTYGLYVDRLQSELRALYASDLPRDAKLARKAEILERAKRDIRALPFENPASVRLADRPLNNAVLATHATYFGLDARFDAVYSALDCDLRAFVRFMHDEVARAHEPVAFIDRWIASHPSRRACPDAHD